MFPHREALMPMVLKRARMLPQQIGIKRVVRGSRRRRSAKRANSRKSRNQSLLLPLPSRVPDKAKYKNTSIESRHKMRSFLKISQQNNPLIKN